MYHFSPPHRKTKEKYPTNVIRINSIATAFTSKLNPLLHNLPNTPLPDIKPLLFFPERQTRAHILRSDALVIGAPILARAGGDVTNHFLPRSMQFLHRLS